MKRLRVAHVSTQRTFRGGENQALMLMRGLRERGCTSVLFAPGGAGLASRARGDGFRVRALPFRSEFDVGSALKLSRLLRPDGFDVAHFHDAHAVATGGMGAYLAGLRARVATRRVVFPVTGGWKWRRLVSHVIAISEAVRLKLLEAGVPSERVSVVYSAVNADRFDCDRAAPSWLADLLDLLRREGTEATKPPHGHNARLVTCAAALTSEKGHEELLTAFSRVAPEFPDAVLLLAGEGPMEGVLRERARRLRLVSSPPRGGDRVRFVGRREDLPEVLSASELFVMPSRSEGLGSAVLEAMWCGVPVVTTDAGGLPEAVGDCGRVVPAGDARALADGIELALGRPDESRRLARAARERARRLFSPDAMVEGTLAVYREALCALSAGHGKGGGHGEGGEGGERGRVG